MSNLPEKKDNLPDLPPVDMQSALLEIVRRKDIDPERLKQFLDLQIQMEERQARMAFMNAMAGFQGDCPVIPKTKRVNFKSVDYKYSPIEEMTKLITPITRKWGLSYSFDIRKTDNPKEHNLVTIISHEAGYSKEYNYYFNPVHEDDRMNGNQKAKSSVTYAKRAALENALGIVTGGEDNDGRGSEDDNVMTSDQLNQIRSLIKATMTDEKKFLEFMEHGKLEDFSKKSAGYAIRALQKKMAVSNV